MKQITIELPLECYHCGSINNKEVEIGIMDSSTKHISHPQNTFTCHKCGKDFSFSHCISVDDTDEV